MKQDFQLCIALYGRPSHKWEEGELQFLVDAFILKENHKPDPKNRYASPFFYIDHQELPLRFEMDDLVEKELENLNKTISTEREAFYHKLKELEDRKEELFCIEHKPEPEGDLNAPHYKELDDDTPF